MRMFGAEEVTSSSFWRKSREKDGIAAVLEDREVVWEQRLKDVEAEQRLKAVTSPGFSFSAAGLLFPYHLGVANCLIQKGYIKVRTSFGMIRLSFLISDQILFVVYAFVTDKF